MLGPRPAAVLATVVLVALAGCGDDAGTTTTGVTLPSGCARVHMPPPKDVNLKPPKAKLPRGARRSATVKTSCGSFTIALDTKGSPLTTSSFAYLAKRGLYDNTAFNRIVPRFVIQAGDVKQTGTSGPGYHVDEPPPARTRYVRGTVAMGKGQVEPPGRSGSQFFVVTAPDAGLTADYALLGRVTKGMSVVDRIAKLGDPNSGDVGTPLAPVVIDRVAISGR
jgi:cyclophilin family peptidyl-prolyl cis-trans isomerase